MIHTVKGFGIVNKAEIDVFLELSCFFHDPADVGNLIPGSSAFSKTSLNIWKFTVHMLMKFGLETTWPASSETCMQVRKQQLELNMEQQTGSKSGKEYVKAVYCHSAYLTSMQSTSWEMLGWKKHKLESRLAGKISITSDMHMTPPLWQKVKSN